MTREPHSDDLNERDLFGNEPDDGISLASVAVLVILALMIALTVLPFVAWWLS